MEPIAAVSTPDEPPPRTLKQRRGRPGLASAIFVFLMPHLWIGVGLVMGALGQCVFPFVCVDVDGHVSRSWVGRGKNGPTYSLEVTYRLASDVEVVTVNTDPTTYANTKLGDVVKMRAADILGFHTAKRTEDSDFPILIPFALFWNGIMAVFLYQLAFVPLSRWWLVRRGAKARGVVDEVKIGEGRKARATVRFHYTPALGEPRVDVTMTVLPSVCREAALKGDCTVFFHPQHTKLAAIYELTSWEIV